MVKAKKTTKKSKTVTKAASVKRAKRLPKVSNKLVNFKIYKERTPFLTFKITEQTFYWFIVTSLIFCLALWVLSIQLKTTYLLESISQSFM